MKNLKPQLHENNTSNKKPSDILKRKLELFRTHYRSEYGMEMDDETLYFFIRVNEFQSKLEKKIDNIPEIRFRNGWDYFLYGLGKNFIWLFVIFGILIIIVLLIKK